MAAFEHFPLDSLNQIKRYPGNHRCCDCPSLDTTWASVSHGTLICLECAGKHRSLGVQVSFVRSITMDSWSKQQIEMLKHGGNGQIQRYFERMDLQEKSINEIYCSDAADCYRQKLSDKVKRVASIDTNSIEKLKFKSSSELSSPSSSSSNTSPSNNYTYSVTFGEGTMGVTLTKDHADLAVVSKVVPGGSAERSGVMVGDFIVGVKDKSVQNYDLVMHQISCSSRPILIRFGRLRSPPKPLHHLLQPSRSEPVLSDYIEPSLDSEFNEKRHISSKYSPKENCSERFSEYTITSLATRGRQTYEDLSTLDEPSQGSTYEDDMNILTKEIDRQLSSKQQLPAIEDDSLKLSEESMKLSSDSQCVSSQSTQFKNQVKILDNLFAWCDGTITRIHRNNSFQVVYSDTGTIEKYVEATRIALLPNISYDPKVSKRVTNIYDVTKGTSLRNCSNYNSNCVLSSSNTSERNSTASPLPYAEDVILSTEDFSTKNKVVHLLESPLGFSLGKGLQGEAIVIKVVAGSIVDSHGIAVGDILSQINNQLIPDYDEAMNQLLICDYPISLMFRPRNKRETVSSKGTNSESSSPNRLFSPDSSPPLLSNYLSQRSTITSSTATMIAAIDEFSITIHQADLGFEVKADIRDGNESSIVTSMRDNSQVRKCGVRIGYAVVAVNKQYCTSHVAIVNALSNSKRPISVTFRKNSS